MKEPDRDLRQKVDRHMRSDIFSWDTETGNDFPLIKRAEWEGSLSHSKEDCSKAQSKFGAAQATKRRPEWLLFWVWRRVAGDGGTLVDHGKTLRGNIQESTLKARKCRTNVRDYFKGFSEYPLYTWQPNMILTVPKPLKKILL